MVRFESCRVQGFLALGLIAVSTTALLGQTQAPPVAIASQSSSTPSAQPAFEVASIRQNTYSTVHDHNHIVSSSNDGHFTAINVPLKMLLAYAFALPETRILGGPDWINSEKFDIEAKADSAIDDQLKKLSWDEGKMQKRQMIQALLADRFQLATHRETREFLIYALVAAKGGPKHLQADTNGTTISHGSNRIFVQGSDSTMALLAEELAKEVGRVVIDKTGIHGRYDITLTWTPDQGAGAIFGSSKSNSVGSSGPSIFTALQEQLGLKLES